MRKFRALFYGVNSGRAARFVRGDHAAGSAKARQTLAAGSAGLAGAFVLGYNELVERGLGGIGVSRGVRDE